MCQRHHASNALERAFRREDRAKTLGDFQDETFGEIQDAMRRLFPDLVLNSLGNPLYVDRSFTFDQREQVEIFLIRISLEEKSLLIKPGMPTYDELKEIIFGSDTADT